MNAMHVLEDTARLLPDTLCGIRYANRCSTDVWLDRRQWEHTRRNTAKVPPPEWVRDLPRMCTTCEERALAIQTEQQLTVRGCPHCIQHKLDGSQFCPSCGESLARLR